MNVHCMCLKEHIQIVIFFYNFKFKCVPKKKNVGQGLSACYHASDTISQFWFVSSIKHSRPSHHLY